VTGVVLLLVLGGLLAVSLAGPVRHIQVEHALHGRFGDDAREAVIRQWAQRLIDTAERYERLDHFGHRLRSRAFAGTTMHIDAGPGDWYSWCFADGETWQVRHLDRPPRLLRRVVVHETVERGEDGLMVRTYVPGGLGISLPVADAHPVSRTGRFRDDVPGT
jgi:hypothetical protein